MKQDLGAGELRRTWDPALLGFSSTADVEPLDTIVGQARAVSALKFGLEIQGAGFNVYVAGPHGIGKMTAVRSFLEELAQSRPTPPDWCYVNDFEDPLRPRALRLPPGSGRRFQAEMSRLVERIRREVPRAFESEEYRQKREDVRKTFDRQRIALLERMNERAAQAGFALQPTPIGVMVVPVLGGRPLSEGEFQALPQAARAEILDRREKLQDDIGAMMKELRELERAATEKLAALDREVALYVVGAPIDELLERYRELPDVVAFLEAARDDILEHIDDLKAGRGENSGLAALFANAPEELTARRYRVNVFVDNGRRQGAPVVVELNPSYQRLLGRVEKESVLGGAYTDFTMIVAGALHQANGGYLVLPIEDVLRSPFAWEGLKRALYAREAQIEDVAERLGLASTRTLRPAPIPLDVKVVLVGRPAIFRLLHAYDEHFPELFKVKADFDTSMEATATNVRRLASFVRTLCEKEHLRHLDGGAVAKLLEHAGRLAEDQRHLSTHFGALADVVREANHWASVAGAPLVGAAEIRRALEEKVYRSNLIEERLREMMQRGILLVRTQGEAVGQLNALAVIGTGDYAFGRPCRVTVSVGPGREGIIDIEREVELAGPLYSKGVMILGGFLVDRFGRDFPLSLNARFVFEQSYDEIEGDSASSTEAYAILSALAGVPLRQGVAVTGSVNQRGEVQAVGGVNEKVEGFFDLCRVRGLTGEEGVIVPRANVEHLMLREDVVEAVREGRFHVWAVSTVDEGIEILANRAAGERGADGEFPPGTINRMVECRLRELAHVLEGREEPEPARPALVR